MGRVIDATGIQFRMLNLRKGPAMHSPRAQADKRLYQAEVKRLCEEQENLSLRQEVVEDILTEGDDSTDPRITGVRVRGDAVYRARAVVLTTDTFLQALMHTGEAKTPGGRGGEGTSSGISGALNRLGVELQRFKTGTPPRLNGRTIDYSRTELQPGDERPQPFSYLTDSFEVEQLPCYITTSTSHVSRPAHHSLRNSIPNKPNLFPLLPITIDTLPSHPPRRVASTAPVMRR
jgi:tRNA uridine 5-carboxymethylaminomethyl modification enzyme